MTLKVRALDVNGDYQLGRGSKIFFVDSAAAVAQKIKTRLSLYQGEWFLDLSATTPWMQQILGKHASAPPQSPERAINMLYDVALKTVISGTRGFSQMLDYSSTLDSTTRMLSVSASVLTVFSNTPITISQSIQISPFGLGITPLG